MKRPVITMNDGTEFTFDYGMLSPNGGSGRIA